MNIKDLIAEVRASKANVTNKHGDFEPWCRPIMTGIADDAVLLADEVERLNAENATLRDNLKHVEHALGDRIKPGQTPERAIADLIADMDRMAAQLEDARLTLAADTWSAAREAPETLTLDVLHRVAWFLGLDLKVEIGPAIDS